MPTHLPLVGPIKRVQSLQSFTVTQLTWSKRRMNALRQLEIVKGFPSIDPGRRTTVSPITSSAVNREASKSCLSDLKKYKFKEQLLL